MIAVITMFIAAGTTKLCCLSSSDDVSMWIRYTSSLASGSRNDCRYLGALEKGGRGPVLD